MSVTRRVRAMSGPRRVLLVALAIAVVPLVTAAVVVRVLFTLEDQGASQSATIANQGRDVHGLQATNGRQADDIHRLTLAVDAFRALVLATTPEQRQAALSQLQAAGAGAPAAAQPAPSSPPAARPSATTTTGPAHEPRPADGGSAGTANTAGPQPSTSPQPSPSTSPSPPSPPPPSPPPAPPRPPPCRVTLPVVGTCVLR